MPKFLGRLALVASLAIGLCTVVSAAATLPATANVDLHESYTLLRTTYYSKVDPQTLLDGARTALNAQLRKHGVKSELPAMRAGSDAAQNLDQIDRAILAAGRETHESIVALTYAAIEGMATSVHDRWTMFFTPKEYAAFNEALDPKDISGIGVLIQPGGKGKYISAFYVVPRTPADRAGIKSGDVFLSVDGKSTKGMKSKQAVSLLRGAPNTVVHLQIERDGKPLPAPIAITRSEVQPPTVIYKMLPQSIGYIYILAFGKDTPAEFDVALNRLQDAGARAYVLDLRNDGGGYVNSALDISAKFIQTAPIVMIEERGAHATTINADNEAIPPKPMTILVNAYTASASEITAGALQDDGVASLVGEKTFGKGVMQTLTPLPDGSAIKITTAHYLTPNHKDINLKGIEPNVVVAENKDARFGELRYDAQLQAAVALLEKKIADSKP
jgi:carboxyl-terminal processing protease